MTDKDDYGGRVIAEELVEDKEDSRVAERYPVVMNKFSMSTTDIVELIISLVAIMIIILVFLMSKSDHNERIMALGEANRINQVR